ncbi:hypothetical protein ACQ86F_25695 [Streptomyces venezuelae ATCC 10712]
MNQLDLFATEPEEQPTPPAPAAPVRRYLTDLPPAPTPTPATTMRALRSVAPPTPPKPKSRHYHSLTRDPHAHAFEIAEAVGHAWHNSRGGEDIAIPIGTVATLALWPLRGPDAHLAADWWLSLSDQDLMTAFRECWARWWISRPDLIDRAAPLHRWLDDEEPPPGESRPCAPSSRRRSPAACSTAPAAPTPRSARRLTSWARSW